MRLVRRRAEALLPVGLVVLVVPLVCLAVIPVLAAGADEALPFEVQRLSDRVLVLKELSPWESNHVVIISAAGLVLVDPGHTAVIGRLIREAVGRELGRDRIAYVIDTHDHWGHTWGNAAFPEAMVVGHENARRSMLADAANLERRAATMRGQADLAAARLGELEPGSEEALAEQRNRNHLERLAAGLAETGFTIQPPQLTFTDTLRLDLGDLSLDLIRLGVPGQFPGFWCMFRGHCIFLSGSPTINTESRPPNGVGSTSGFNESALTVRICSRLDPS